VTEARLYDRIGTGYPATRRTEPRIAARIDAALGTAETVVNVGAGTGCYEPPGRRVTAVEPSAVMLGQRPSGGAPAVQAVAESLPFANASFDAAMAVWTVHHWADPAAGLAELGRVGRARAWPSARHALTAAGWSILIELAAGLLATAVWVGALVLT